MAPKWHIRPSSSVHLDASASMLYHDLMGTSTSLLHGGNPSGEVRRIPNLATNGSDAVLDGSVIPLYEAGPETGLPSTRYLTNNHMTTGGTLPTNLIDVTFFVVFTSINTSRQILVSNRATSAENTPGGITQGLQNNICRMDVWDDSALQTNL